MNMLDSMLTSDALIIQDIGDEMGPQHADGFLSAFNNACLQFAGFETYLDEHPALKLAPLTNLSYSEYH